MKKYRITLTKEQLMLIANCVEDCHRSLAYWDAGSIRNCYSYYKNNTLLCFLQKYFAFCKILCIFAL